ncbi:MAG: class II aldolase/adducin family protein [Anaerolineales bacterium]|nr:class II aldolase/adducin family protein [Anaerolineales bacterium]
MLLPEYRQEVLEKAQQTVIDGLAYGAGGNLSVQDPETGLIAITPSAIEYAKMIVEDIVIIDAHGKVIEGKWGPTSETPMHTIFYRERDDVRAVVHTHAPYASVFAIINEPIPMVVAEAALCVGGPVQVAPYTRPGTDELAQVVLETIGSGVSVLLGQHGMITVGRSLDEAYSATIATEVSARLTILARSMGAAPLAIDRQEVAELREMYLKHYHPTSSDER